MAKISDEKIAQIQAKYKELGVYSQVAKIVGCSPATVKKYTSMEDISETIKAKESRYATLAQIKQCRIDMEKKRKYTFASPEDVLINSKKDGFEWGVLSEDCRKEIENYDICS